MLRSYTASSRGLPLDPWKFHGKPARSANLLTLQRNAATSASLVETLQATLCHALLCKVKDRSQSWKASEEPCKVLDLDDRSIEFVPVVFAARLSHALESLM